jgi:hypothetical protein
MAVQAQGMILTYSLIFIVLMLSGAEKLPKGSLAEMKISWGDIVTVALTIGIVFPIMIQIFFMA